MAKRLHMTTADYVAIAISPALVMALVGSLVFFLIEAFYVGQHPARLNYVFAWFVFATVLIARIAIEMGSERALLFALPLGVITFLAMVRYVEQPGPFGQLVNVALLGVVWWSAHKLTWDCTLIDDDEDASGEGLMQQVQGARRLFSRRTDASVEDGDRREKRLPTPPRAENELPLELDESLPDSVPGWRDRSRNGRRPHAPGLWVLYFSLAALPLFGLGQRWIPPSDVGSRRYAFFLLVVYVAAGLSLLVTTSFLGLRRYLRQRRVEMPAPMAATWVGVGAALIVVVMVVVALLPRPAAEVAISQVPWQLGSRADLSRSRTGLNTDDIEAQDETDAATDEGAQTPGKAEHEGQNPSGAQTPDESSDSERSAPGERGRESSRSSAAEEASSRTKDDTAPPSQGQRQASRESAARPADAAAPDSGPLTDSEPLRAFETVQALPWSSITDLFKWIFYFVVGFLILIFVWRNFAQLANSLVEVFRQLRELLALLLGGGRAADAGNGPGDRAAEATRPLPRFHDYLNPFATGRNEQLPPNELVRYTFEAFEAWARDSGQARTPDQTPHELVRMAVPRQTPMHAEACRMAELYSEAAYGTGAVSPQAASGLKRIWTMMQDSASRRN